MGGVDVLGCPANLNDRVHFLAEPNAVLPFHFMVMSLRHAHWPMEPRIVVKVQSVLLHIGNKSPLQVYPTGHLHSCVLIRGIHKDG